MATASDLQGKGVVDMRGLLWALTMEAVKAVVSLIAAIAIYRKVMAYMAAILGLFDRF